MLTPGNRPQCSLGLKAVLPLTSKETPTSSIKKNQKTTQIFTYYKNSFSLVFIFVAFSSFVTFVDAQALNDPITQYIEGRLGNRRIFWCPSGYGYLAYCPQPTDWDNYNWCCTWPYMGSWKPSCCPFALPTGAVVAIIIASIILFAVLIGLSCWCCFCCPLYKKLYEYEDDDDDYEPSHQQLQFSSNH